MWLELGADVGRRTPDARQRLDQGEGATPANGERHGFLPDHQISICFHSSVPLPLCAFVPAPYMFSVIRVLSSTGLVLILRRALG